MLATTLQLTGACNLTLQSIRINRVVIVKSGSKSWWLVGYCTRREKISLLFTTNGRC